MDYLAGDGVSPLGYILVPAVAVLLGESATTLVLVGGCLVLLAKRCRPYLPTAAVMVTNNGPDRRGGDPGRSAP